MKTNKQQNPWVTAVVVISIVIAAAGVIFGVVKGVQAILTEARYRALEKALREENLDTDVAVSAADIDLDLSAEEAE